MSSDFAAGNNMQPVFTNTRGRALAAVQVFAAEGGLYCYQRARVRRHETALWAADMADAADINALIESDREWEQHT